MIIVLDTNCILHNHNVLQSFPRDIVVIPFQVCEEIDKFKTAPGEVGVNCRRAISYIDSLRKKGSLHNGVKQPNGSLLVVADLPTADRDVSVDKKILICTMNLRDQAVKGFSKDSPFFGQTEVMLLTKDINLRILSDVKGVKVDDYIDFAADCNYLGWQNLELSETEYEAICGTAANQSPSELILESDRNLTLNEYVNLHYNGVLYNGKTGIYKGNGKLEFIPNKYHLCGLEPKNLEQRMAIHALLNDDASLVTLKAKAGTGKTLLAIAAAIQKVFREGKYDRIVITRPVVPIGNDIGFLPGELKEKMMPWIKPILDNIKVVINLNKGKGKKKTGAELDDLSKEENLDQLMEIIPITYMRGRSIPRAFMIVDEAQNTTPGEMATIITRMGEGSKLVLTGDTDQIDNRFLSKDCNGLAMAINKFKGQDLFSHVTLTKTERSRLAEIASNILFEE